MPVSALGAQCRCYFLVNICFLEEESWCLEGIDKLVTTNTEAEVSGDTEVDDLVESRGETFSAPTFCMPYSKRDNVSLLY